jgi:LacI family transcriptional regulator
MASKTPRSRADVLLAICRRIEATSGSTDARLPSERMLAQELGASRETVRRALEQLQKDGHLQRRRRLGTRLLNPGTPVMTTGNTLFLGDSAAHFYSTVAQQIVAAHSTPGQVTCLNPETHDNWPEYLSRATRIVCATYWLDEVFNHLAPSQSLIAFGVWPAATMHPVLQITTDQVRAAALAVEHLAELGHTAIGLIGGTPVGPGEDPDLTVPSPHKPVAQGWRMGITANSQRRGIALGVDATEPHTPQRIAKYLERYRGRQTAVLCDADFRAREVIRIAERIGIRVPQDLSVMGIGNTPWTTKGGISLTTVDLGAHEIGRLSTMCQGHGWPAGSIIRVEPHLVVGKTCRKISTA